MKTWRAAGITLVVSLVFAAACAGWAPTDESSARSTPAPPQEEATSPPERARSHNVGAPAPLPAKDVPGQDVSDLPRYPGSVRIEYERNRHDDLILTRVRYLSAEKLDTVRGFYRGVFRSEDWRVANVEFSDGEWSFLAVKGQREADIEVRPHGAGVEMDVQLSAPAPHRKPERDASAETPRSKRNASREAAPSRAPAPEPPVPSATAPATVPPASVPPATAPGGYGYEDDDGGEYEDDGWDGDD